MIYILLSVSANGVVMLHFLMYGLSQLSLWLFLSLSMLCTTGHDCDSQVRMPNFGNTYMFNANHNAIRMKNQIASFIAVPFVFYPQDEPVSTMKPAPYGVSTKSMVMVRSASMNCAISVS